MKALTELSASKIFRRDNLTEWEKYVPFSSFSSSSFIVMSSRPVGLDKGSLMDGKPLL